MTKAGVKQRIVTTGTFKTDDVTRFLVNQVLDSNRISYGEMTKKFELKFAKLHNCEYAIMSNSGTSALQIALQAMKEIHKWPDGSIVIVPATTFVATANIVQHCRMEPIFVDVDPNTYNIDVAMLYDEIRAYDDPSCIKAVIPVHLFGQPADMSGVKMAISGTNIKIIEDSCECMFASHKGETVGSIGDIGCFSTYAAHLIVTGVGGISTTNNPDYAAKMRSLVNHGLEIAHLNVEENFAPRPMPNRRFRFDTIGHSYRITEFEAALGLAQLEKKHRFWMLRMRDRNAKHLTAGLSNVNDHYDNPLQLPEVQDGNTHSWMMYPIVLRNGVDKEPLMTWLNERGVETRDMLPLVNQPAYNYLSEDTFPVSHTLVKSGFYVGCHQDLTPEDIDYVIQTIEYYFSENRT
jgi:dTDP-4-amino-4,6-dideoxygalactose transaminase